MGLGILDDRSGLENVPGTVLLAEKTAEPEGQVAQLKHGTGRNSRTVLIPQPTNDPNDPLNWSYSKKVAIIAIIVYGATLCAAVFGPLLNAGLFVIAQQFGRPIGDITIISGYQLLVAGCSGPFISAGARKWGKRPVFLFSSFMGLVGTIIGSAGGGYNTLLAGRIIQGLSTAAYESLIFPIISDLFFVHERGVYAAVMSFILSSIGNLASVVTGPITTALGWRYLFHISNAALGLQLVLLYLFVPETTYQRKQNAFDTVLVSDKMDAMTKENVEGENSEGGKVEATFTEDSQRDTPIPPKKTFTQELAIFTGTYSHENWASLLLGPFISCLNVTAFWTVAVSGAIISFYVAAAYVIAQIFSPPPYLLTAAGVGYLSVGPFLGGSLGSILIGVLSDRVAVGLARRNGGVYEPEFRLPLGLFGLFTGGGLIGFGMVLQKLGNMYLACFFWGMALFGVACIAGAASAYAVDAFRDMSNEIFVANIMFKNFLFYGYSYFVNNWTASSGPKVVFDCFGGIAFGLVATTPIVYVFGKRYRAFWHRNNMFIKFGVQAHSE